MADDFKSIEMYMHINVRLIFSLCKTGWRVGGGIITECLLMGNCVGSLFYC